MSDEARQEHVAAEVARQKALILRGVVDCISAADLDRKLAKSLLSGKPLRVKLGVDPTSSMLHLGFTVVLNKLRTFQDLGHQAVLILGDATALVGDPTGRNKTRPRLSPEEIRKNAEGYLEQAGKVLDLSRLEVRKNSEWLGKLDFLGMINLVSRATVARLLERDDFSKRYKEGTPIHLHELVYPLLQGLDSVQIASDVELGGTDQLFNLLMGRDLQAEDGQEPQVCLTTPILVGLDGKLKMSKSYGNTVGISEPPSDMMIKIMRLDDTLLREWFTLVTRIPLAKIDEVLAAGRNPRDSKLDLGRTIVGMYHGEPAGEAAAKSWLEVVSGKALPEDLKSLDLGGLKRSATGGILILDLLMSTGWFQSKGEARRQIDQKSVSLGESRIVDQSAEVHPAEGDILRCGKQRVVRLRL